VRSVIKGRLGATLFELIEPAKLPPNYINLFTSISKISLTGFWGIVIEERRTAGVAVGKG